MQLPKIAKTLVTRYRTGLSWLMAGSGIILAVLATLTINQIVSTKIGLSHNRQLDGVEESLNKTKSGKPRRGPASEERQEEGKDNDD